MSINLSAREGTYFLYQPSKLPMPDAANRPVLRVAKKNGSKAQVWLKQHKLQDSAYKVISTEDSIYFPLVNSPDPDIAIPKSWTIESYDVLPRKPQQNHRKLLQQLLPPDLHSLIPHGFDQLGKIVLLKLDSELLPYKQQIGVIYLKILRVESVFIKIGEVHSLFRTSHWECIAGSNSPISQVQLYGLRLQVNIQEVYFNPRLGQEYLQIARQCQPDEVIIDMFAGIGPFALMCAKEQNVIVHACELNPAAIELFKENVVLNQKKIQGEIHVYQGDSRKILPELPAVNRIIMNLPGQAIKFLDIALTRLQAGGCLHLHQFVPNPRQQDKLILDEFQKKISTILTKHSTNFYDVEASWQITNRMLREVSPSKAHIVWDIKNLDKLRSNA